MLTGTTGALVQAALSSLQFPMQVRAWYAVIGSPPVLTGAPQLTVTVGVPDPRFRSAAEETRALTAVGALGAA